MSSEPFDPPFRVTPIPETTPNVPRDREVLRGKELEEAITKLRHAWTQRIRYILNERGKRVIKPGPEFIPRGRPGTFRYIDTSSERLPVRGTTMLTSPIVVRRRRGAR